MPPLGNAVHDALGVLQLFQRLGFQQAAEPLVNDAATGAAMNRLVSEPLRTLDADDSLVVFFAGHGTTRVRQDPDGTTVKTGYVLPCDAEAASAETASWIELDAWLDRIARLPVRHVLVILDACYGGIALSSLVQHHAGSGLESLDRLRLRRSRRIITSGLDDQPVMDSGPVPGHSLFTGCLIAALGDELAGDGRTFATGSELAVHVQRRVATYPDSQQIPDFGVFTRDDRGEMMIPLIAPSLAGR
jgi:uncharacterized caspase-like protein